MNIEQIRQKAKEMGINSEGVDKITLIRSIQDAEGFQRCYGRGMFVCENLNCLWRDLCLGISQVIKFEVLE